jgi:hypothetical protein
VEETSSSGAASATPAATGTFDLNDALPASSSHDIFPAGKRSKKRNGSRFTGALDRQVRRSSRKSNKSQANRLAKLLHNASNDASLQQQVRVLSSVWFKIVLL